MNVTMKRSPEIVFDIEVDLRQMFESVDARIGALRALSAQLLTAEEDPIGTKWEFDPRLDRLILRVAVTQKDAELLRG